VEHHADTAPPASTLAVPPVRPTNRPQYNKAHKLTSRALRAEHVAEYGSWCPGLEGVRDAHLSDDLVADHNSAGDASAGYTIRCRACNSSRRNHGLG